MIEVSKTVAQFIGDFKSLDYCCHRIIELNEELEVLNHKMLGLSHSVEELSKEQMKSSLPMPTYQRTFLKLKSGKIGTHSFTDASVSSSINFINKENLLTSTA